MNVDPESAPIAQVIKQRRASIYTVNSDHNPILQSEIDALQRRLSRLSNKSSSGRSEYGGQNIIVPVVSNIIDADVSATAEVVDQKVLQTPTYQVSLINIVFGFIF